VNDVIELGLHEFLDDLQLNINEISDAIHQTFFKLDIAPPSQQQTQ